MNIYMYSNFTIFSLYMLKGITILDQALSSLRNLSRNKGKSISLAPMM